MLKEIAVIIYKKILEKRRNKDTQCQAGRSIFRPFFICYIFSSYQKATAGFWQLPFDILMNFIQKQPVNQHAFLPNAFYWILNITEGTSQQCRSPPPLGFKHYGFN